MEKLELKHIVGYLPYELSFLNNENDFELTVNGVTDENKVFNHGQGHFNFEDIKLLLRHLYDLTKEIEVNGEKFVPIDYIRFNISDKLIYSTTGFPDFETSKEKELHLSIYDVFEYEMTLSEMIQVLEKLYEWHFDIHDLIGKGLAIDINTLTK